ncbi:MAG: protein translocase subunit SecF [Acidimicrobiales bacterium]
MSDVMPPVTEERALAKRSIWTKLYHGETRIRFVPGLKRWAMVSGLIIVLGLLSLWQRGLNLGIDFKGGIVWEVPAGDVSVSDAESALDDNGLEGLTIQTLTAQDEVRLRIEAAPSEDTDKVQGVTQELAEITGSNIEDVSLNAVGPSWGEEISRKAVRALVVFLILITIYITLRFELRMAIPTLVALIHDVLITVGVYSLAGFEVTPATVIAVLTILGFSIYDGIVVFDKVDENTKLVGTTNNMTYSDMIDLSLNQVLMRSLNTSITALLPVASLLVLGSYILGATTLQEFALALLIGLFAGAYSSLFIASPMLAVLKEREPKYRDIRRRIEGRSAAVPVPVTASRGSTDGDERAPAAAAPALSGRPIPPRPRKKGKKR